MSRRSVRKQLFKLVFRIEFQELAEMDEQARLFFEDDENGNDESKDEVQNKLKSILELLPDIDKSIRENLTGWTLERVGKVELAILRLAVYEMKYDDEVPVSVAINEAVELAKQYGPDEAPGFINAVLSKLA